MIFDVMLFHLYLYGRQILLVADRRPLVFVPGYKTGVAPIAAVSIERKLQCYLRTPIQYNVGGQKNNRKANALSHLPLAQSGVPWAETTLLLVDYFAVLPMTTQAARDALRND